MDLGIYEKSKWPRSIATVSSLANIQDSQSVYNDIKIGENTKINHIMISFSGHYNAISIDRLPLKTKAGKVS